MSSINALKTLFFGLKCVGHHGKRAFQTFFASDGLFVTQLVDFQRRALV